MAISDATLKQWEKRLKDMEERLKKSPSYNLRQEVEYLRRNIKNSKIERERLKPQLLKKEGKIMDDIQNRLDKYLIGESTLKEYDEWTDTENEIKEIFKELGKEFGNSDGNSATLFPYKHSEAWEIYVTADDYNEIEYDLTINFYDTGIGLGGNITLNTDELDANRVKEIGKLQKKFADAVLDVMNGLKKMGKVIT